VKQSINIEAVQAQVFKVPLEVPVQTSFGLMHERPMVLVRIVDVSGRSGWGEVWCNFPQVGAEHRARLVDSVFAPLLAGRRFDDPGAAYRRMCEATRILAIQSAEPGPFAQVIAGLDMAFWDLAAIQAEQPLWRFLGATDPKISVYASGLNPTEPAKLAAKCHDQGYRAFKLKIGFGTERDLANLTSLRQALGQDAHLMVDANQGWQLAEALSFVARLEPFNLGWLEEPLCADRPWEEWRRLKESTSIPLAAGENIAGEQAFSLALDAAVLGVVQPDAAKWGGLTAGLPLAKAIMAAQHRYFPHYLGGGIGLLASAHLLAAAGGDGALEIDANPNPLRTDLCDPLNEIENGTAMLTDRPGLGVTPDLERLNRYAVAH
jgi:D-galactarolactone cycloisomerase